MNLAYSKYQQSEFEWLGSIPEHWKIMKAKDICNRIGDGLHGTPIYTDNQPYHFINGNNLTNGKIDLEGSRTISEDEFLKLKIQFSPQTLFLSINGTIGNLSFYNNERIALGKSVAYIEFKKNLFIEYFYFVFQTNTVLDFIELELTGTTIKNLSLKTIRNTFFLVPPLEEQIAIAQYLDTKTQTIDKKINLLTKKADLYKELRKSTINEIVTKGLDATVKLKDSGIDWIGQIPEHWEVKRIKALGEIETSSVNKKIEENEELVKLVNYTDVYGNMNKEIWNNDNYMVVSANKLQVKYKRLKQGDVLFTPSSETITDIGVSAVVMEDLNNTLYSYHILRLKLSNKMYLNFKKYLFNNDFVQEYFSKSATGTTRKILGLNTFYNLPVVFPESVNEQTAIANYLDEKTQKIDAIINHLQLIINHYKEFRKTLINDVVTGKIKVIN